MRRLQLLALFFLHPRLSRKRIVTLAPVGISAASEVAGQVVPRNEIRPSVWFDETVSTTSATAPNRSVSSSSGVKLVSEGTKRCRVDRRKTINANDDTNHAVKE